MREIGVGVLSAEIFERRAVDDRVCGRAQTLFQYVPGVRAGDGVHRIERHAEAAGEERAQSSEVKQLFHHRRVVGERTNKDDFGVADFNAALGVEVYIGVIERAVFCDRERLLVDALGYGFGRGPAVADVVLDAEVFVYTAGVVAGGENEAAERAASPDDGGNGGRRKDTAAPDEQSPKAVRGGHANDRLDGCAIVVTPVATNDQCLLLEVRPVTRAHSIEDRLDKVLQIAGLHEDARLFAQA